MATEKWVARAEYEDGTSIEKEFPYLEGGNYEKECDRQYQLECWLLERDAVCTWYSVDYVVD